MYFVTSEGNVVDPLTETAIDESDFEEAVRTANIEGPRGPYVVRIGLKLPLYRVNLSFTLFVKGPVPFGDMDKFARVLLSVWRGIMPSKLAYIPIIQLRFLLGYLLSGIFPVSDIHILVLRTEEYVYEG